MTPEKLGRRSRPSITLDGLERAAELLEYRLTPDDSDDLTLIDPFAAAEWHLSGKAYQTLASGTLYRFTRAHSGETVPFVIRPMGNTVPTVDAPHYRGSLIVGQRPALGGSAGERAFLFEFTWRVLGEPEEVTA